MESKIKIKRLKANLLQKEKVLRTDYSRLIAEEFGIVVGDYVEWIETETVFNKVFNTEVYSNIIDNDGELWVNGCGSLIDMCEMKGFRKYDRET